ncbi:hypothetical protein Pst134EB_026562 [Puccinia striiformis f. sp. tritici]|nr:hypothetical protein Pst134EB_026562 [Puccinia striiformis f. sp. tritici]
MEPMKESTLNSHLNPNQTYFTQHSVHFIFLNYIYDCMFILIDECNGNLCKSLIPERDRQRCSGSDDAKYQPATQGQKEATCVNTSFTTKVFNGRLLCGAFLNNDE